ncbi:MAG: peptidylprolyl isomerase [Parvibaculum sp.]
MKSEKLACSFTPASEKLFPRLVAYLGAAVLCVCLSAALMAGPAFAEGGTVDQPLTVDQQGIAAVVNDKIVSQYDLEQRVKLIMVTSGIPDTPQNKSRIEPQVLRGLIDESLETQEANRLEVKVEQEEIDKQLEGIAKRANMTMEEIDEFLKKNDVSRSSLVNQIHAEIAWNKVISQQFSPLVTVSDEEVDDLLKRLKEESDQPRYNISEILLTYDTPAQAEEMTGGAERLAEQIRAGAPFGAVAQQFSRSPSAANGGDIGWVHLSQLPREVAPVVEQMGIGEISSPIKTLNGIYLIQLKNKQVGVGSDPMKDRWTLARVLLPLSPDAPDNMVERRAKEALKFTQEFKSCDALSQQIKAYVGGVASEPRTVVFGSLDARMQSLVSKSKPGEVIPPIRSREGIEMVAVCGHQVDDPQMPSRESIEDSLYSQQLSMMSRRHLRDLHRDAVIEIR